MELLTIVYYTYTKQPQLITTPSFPILFEMAVIATKNLSEVCLEISTTSTVDKKYQYQKHFRIIPHVQFSIYQYAAPSPLAQPFFLAGT
jgi:hypothetical protein